MQPREYEPAVTLQATRVGRDRNRSVIAAGSCRVTAEGRWPSGASRAFMDGCVTGGAPDPGRSSALDTWRAPDGVGAPSEALTAPLPAQEYGVGLFNPPSRPGALARGRHRLGDRPRHSVWLPRAPLPPPPRRQPLLHGLGRRLVQLMPRTAAVPAIPSDPAFPDALAPTSHNETPNPPRPASRPGRHRATRRSQGEHRSHLAPASAIAVATATALTPAAMRPVGMWVQSHERQSQPAAIAVVGGRP
jgi:hypothetical protein